MTERILVAATPAIQPAPLLNTISEKSMLAYASIGLCG